MFSTLIHKQIIGFKTKLVWGLKPMMVTIYQKVKFIGSKVKVMMIFLKNCSAYKSWSIIWMGSIMNISVLNAFSFFIICCVGWSVRPSVGPSARIIFHFNSWTDDRIETKIAVRVNINDDQNLLKKKKRSIGQRSS